MLPALRDLWGLWGLLDHQGLREKGEIPVAPAFLDPRVKLARKVFKDSRVNRDHLAFGVSEAIQVRKGNRVLRELRDGQLRHQYPQRLLARPVYQLPLTTRLLGRLLQVR